MASGFWWIITQIKLLKSGYEWQLIGLQFSGTHFKDFLNWCFDFTDWLLTISYAALFLEVNTVLFNNYQAVFNIQTFNKSLLPRL